MRRFRPIASFVFVAAMLVAAIGGTATADPGGVPNDNAAAGVSHRPVCPPTPAGFAHCDSEIVTKADGVTPAATTSYSSGYAPADLQSAYKLPSLTGGVGQTIAIVDAYDNPNAYADLTAYRQQFGLPACLQGTCFRKVNQNGQTSPLPAGNVGWGQEIALDLDMASAICPNCSILLVEANSNSFADLGAAVDRAATMGAQAISNSYGGNEFSSESSSTYNGHFDHPGHALTVSSGDSGYGVEFPAASQYVTAVGGTSLTKNTSTSRGWTETAWNGAGSGCSAVIAKPSWQHDSGCGRRTVADVSAVANPSTGVAVYDSYGSSGGANWYVFGGTSVAAPIIAGVYALAGNAASVNYGSYPYSHTASLFDVTSGSNGHCRRTPYLCTAGAGYDGPTGLGTPNGAGAF